MSLKEIVKDSVAILSPCANSVEPRAYQFGMVLASASSANGYPVRQVGVTERTLIHTARNVLANEFLSTDCEWAFWLDSDMILPPNTIPIMMRWAKELKAQFLTGVYYQRMGDHKPLVLLRNENAVQYKEEAEHSMVIVPDGCKQPFKVHCCGFGCVLMHRDVLLKMDQPFFKYECPTGKKELSEDFYFCINARKKGIDLWAIPELKCGHLGQAPIITKDDFKFDGKTVAIKLETK